MLKGIILELPDSTLVFGAIMPDQQVYLHEPIVDTFGSQEDVLKAYEGASLHIIGQLSQEICESALAEVRVDRLQ